MTLPYGGKLWHRENLAKLTTGQNFAKFSLSKFLHIYNIESHMNVVNVKLTYCETGICDRYQDEQLPEPNSSLSKSMPTKAIELATA